MPQQQPFMTDAWGRRFACSAVAVQAIIVNAEEHVLLLSSPTRNYLHPDIVAIVFADHRDMDAYQDDLAYIHDVGYGDFARDAAPGLLKILGQGGIRKGLVVDLGCGSGLWARQLVDAGYEMLGIDLSAALIDLARQRVPEGEFITRSFLEADLPPCEAVTSLGECFNYLFDERNNWSQLRQLFRRIYAALRPGGLFIFDIAEPGRGQDRQQSHRQGVDWAALVDYESDPIRQQLTRRITTFRQVGTAYRRSHEVHRLQLYRGADIANELRQMGFRVRLVRGYGPFRFPKSYVGFIARKP